MWHGSSIFSFVNADYIMTKFSLCFNTVLKYKCKDQTF